MRVDLFRNETYEPRLTEAMGIALRRTLQQDGTYRLSTHGDADIVVSGVITQYRRLGHFLQPRDVITPRDFQITMAAQVTATERSTGRMHPGPGGRRPNHNPTWAGPNQRGTAGGASLAEDLASNITSLLVDGLW